LNILAPSMLPDQISMNCSQWFIRRFLKVFAKKNFLKCALRAWPFVTPGTSFEQT